MGRDIDCAVSCRFSTITLILKSRVFVFVMIIVSRCDLPYIVYSLDMIKIKFGRTCRSRGRRHPKNVPRQ